MNVLRISWNDLSLIFLFNDFNLFMAADLLFGKVATVDFNGNGLHNDCQPVEFLGPLTSRIFDRRRTHFPLFPQQRW